MEIEQLRRGYADRNSRGERENAQQAHKDMMKGLKRTDILIKVIEKLTLRH